MLNGVYDVTAEQVRSGVEALNRALASEPEPRLRVLPGADVHLHEELVARLRNREALTINDAGKYVLLELPSTVRPSRLDALLFQLQIAGVRPVLTHPERHEGILRHPEDLDGWVERGGLVQVTAGSYLGRFGSAAQKAAERWTREGRVHVVASDAHPLPGREPCLREAAERLRSLVGADGADRLVRDNPGRIVRGEPV
jgi:protein-tyrosine phosphatase